MAIYHLSTYIPEYIGDCDEELYGPASGWWEGTGESLKIESENKDEIEQYLVAKLKKKGHFADSDNPDVDFDMFPEAIIVYTMKTRYIADHQVMLR